MIQKLPRNVTMLTTKPSHPVSLWPTMCRPPSSKWPMNPERFNANNSAHPPSVFVKTRKGSLPLLTRLAAEFYGLERATTKAIFWKPPSPQPNAKSPSMRVCLKRIPIKVSSGPLANYVRMLHKMCSQATSKAGNPLWFEPVLISVLNPGSFVSCMMNPKLHCFWTENKLPCSKMPPSPAVSPYVDLGNPFFR